MADLELNEATRQQIELTVVALHSERAQWDLRNGLIVGPTDTYGDFK